MRLPKRWLGYGLRNRARRASRNVTVHRLSAYSQRLFVHSPSPWQPSVSSQRSENMLRTPSMYWSSLPVLSSLAVHAQPIMVWVYTSRMKPSTSENLEISHFWFFFTCSCFHFFFSFFIFLHFSLYFCGNETVNNLLYLRPLGSRWLMMMMRMMMMLTMLRLRGRGWGWWERYWAYDGGGDDDVDAEAGAGRGYESLLIPTHVDASGVIFSFLTLMISYPIRLYQPTAWQKNDVADRHLQATREGLSVGEYDKGLLFLAR